MSDETVFSARSKQASASSGRQGPPIRLIAFGVLLVVALIFVLQNRDRTTVDFLVFEIHSRVWTAIAVSLGLGVALDRLFLSWWRKWRAARDETPLP